MSATVSTDFLLRVAQATPEQQAAIEGILSGGVLQKGTEATEKEAQRVFLLMQRLEGGAKQRKAPLAGVFRLLVLQGLSQRAAAARCGCVESLISARVAAIERAFGMSIERLRSFASEVLSLEAAAKGERAHKKRYGQPDDLDEANLVGEEEGRVEDEQEEH
jgi:hypothetical protein